jgi:hypothetical protein
LQGELQPGDLLRNQQGHSVAVEKLEEIPRVCKTWNITVEGLHTFFVVDDGVVVLTHNLQPGPRDYTVYTLEWIDPVSGVKKAYTGYATLPAGDSAETKTFKQIMTKRYPGSHYVIRVDDPLKPGKSIKLTLPSNTKLIMRQKPFRHENPLGGPGGMMDSRGKRAKQPGNIIVEGLERLQFAQDVAQYGDANVMNRQRFKRADLRSMAKEAAANLFLDQQGLPCRR